MLIIDFIMCCFDQGVSCSYIPPLIMLEINVISLVDDLYSVRPVNDNVPCKNLETKFCN